MDEEVELFDKKGGSGEEIFRGGEMGRVKMWVRVRNCGSVKLGEEEKGVKNKGVSMTLLRTHSFVCIMKK